MSFFCRLSRKHYWCVPHRSADSRLVQVCYECGAERPVREVIDDFAMERFNHSLASAKAEVIRFSAPQLDERTAPREARIAAGQTLSRRFLLVK